MKQNKDEERFSNDSSSGAYNTLNVRPNGSPCPEHYNTSDSSDDQESDEEFSVNGSFTDTFRRIYGNRHDSPIQNDLGTSKSGDKSIQFVASNTYPTKTGPRPRNDRAGVKGIETISIKTLKNRLYRYRRKLDGLKGKANPDFLDIRKLEDEIAEIDTVLQRRIKEIEENKHIKRGWHEMLDDLCNTEAVEENMNNDDFKGAKPKLLRDRTSPATFSTTDTAFKNQLAVIDRAKNIENINFEQKRQTQKRKGNTHRSIANDIGDTNVYNKGARERSSSFTRSVEVDPEEVFRFMVKDMNGQGTLQDIHSKCDLFKDYNGNLDEWFHKYNRKFAVFKNNASVIKVTVCAKGAEYCLDYMRNCCTKAFCNRYHICRDFLGGLCSFGDNCKFSHNTMDEHNCPISRSLGFYNVFSNAQIRQIIAFRFPKVCESWNTDRSCEETKCCELHICKQQLLGNCSADDCCPFEHSLTTMQNLMVTNAYHVSKWNTKLLFKLILVQRRPSISCAKKQIDYNEQISGPIDTCTSDKWIKDAAAVQQITNRPALTSTNLGKETIAGQSKNQDDSFLRSDHLYGKPRYICEKQLVGRCGSKNCLHFHGDTSRLPYIWQIQLYGKWLSLPLGQMLKLEEDYCRHKKHSGPFIITSEDGMHREYTMHFFPHISAIWTWTVHLDLLTEKFPAQARRLSTPSYAEGEWEDNSFKTQWRWSFEDDFEGCFPFDTDNLQFTLEKKFLDNQWSFLYSRENYRFKYCPEFVYMWQTNLDTKKRRAVYRRPLFVTSDDVAKRQFPLSLQRPVSVSVPLPDGWATWDIAHPFELVDMKLCDKVENDFFKTIDRSSVVIDGIYRVQNPHLWKDFTSYRDTMSEKAERAGRGRGVKELLLFHGTDSIDTVRGIAINNFDHRLSGKNATMYGEGAYFAKNAKYSHGYTKPPERFMFLARVLVGEYTKGESSYKRPPAKPGAAHELYDSCVDNIINPTIYIVFDTKQYYPEFLIQYHTKVEMIKPTSQRIAVIHQAVMPTHHIGSANPLVTAPAQPSTSIQSVSYPRNTVSYPSGSTGNPYSAHSTTQTSSRVRTITSTEAALKLPVDLITHTGRSPTLLKKRAPSPPIVYLQNMVSSPNVSPVRSASPTLIQATKTSSRDQGVTQQGRNREKKCVIQ